jgi:hypothetical protein
MLTAVWIFSTIFVQGFHTIAVYASCSYLIKKTIYACGKEKKAFPLFCIVFDNNFDHLKWNYMDISRKLVIGGRPFCGVPLSHAPQK